MLATRFLEIGAMDPSGLLQVLEPEIWHDNLHKRMNDVINAPIALPAKIVSLQYMMISKIG